MRVYQNPTVSTNKSVQEQMYEEESNRPRPIGRVYKAVQQVDSTIHSLEELLESEDSALLYQRRTPPKVKDLTTWFPHDKDRVAFWTPSKNFNTTQDYYHQLSYSQLQQELQKCYPFTTRSTTTTSTTTTRVAIVMPSEQMAATATAILSVMAKNATAVPLDPRMPSRLLVEAMEQLECHVLVCTQEVLLEQLQLFHNNKERSQLSIIANSDKGSKLDPSSALPYLANLSEIRLVTPGACGQLNWQVYEKQSNDNSTDNSITTWALSSAASNQNRAITHQRQTPQCDNDDICMLLRTSGTTSKPKVVPITRSHLLYAGLTIATTLQLKPADCNCNAMPLFHIGGISCNLIAVLLSGGSVVMAGPLQDPKAFIHHLTIVDDTTTTSTRPEPTWYYASPAMHKAIAMTAQAKGAVIPNRLRFIRSASAHLNHDLALQLSRLFGCGVIPTYGMSEAMPICSSTPIRNDHAGVMDSVGYPVGTSLRIVDPRDKERVLPHGTIGEISVQGPGVISHYVGLDASKTHTVDGWLSTGDQGILDRQGRVFIKGRSKEMIKRGGEQIWPNQIDDCIEKVEGVATSVSFGVTNELLGEEVAAAVVLSSPDRINDPNYLRSLDRVILQACKQHLSPDAKPQQIKFVVSTECLLRGPTGKFQRSQMAAHLNLQAVETGALKVLETVAAMDSSRVTNTHGALKAESAIPGDPQLGRIIPHDSLNGLRFLVACFVVMGHVGKFPNLAWAKLQGYSPNMMIFFALGAIQTTLSVARPVTGRYGQWVGSKIGTLHALFVLSQLVTLPSTILFKCLDEEGTLSCNAADYAVILSSWIFGTTTGLAHGLDGNIFAWFQSVFYIFLMMFPLLDSVLRAQSLFPTNAFIMIVGCAITGALYPILSQILPADLFLDYGWLLHGTILIWFWFVVAAMCAAYFFRYLTKRSPPQLIRDGDIEKAVEAAVPSPNQSDTIEVESVRDYFKCWGYVCDICSILLLICYLSVAMAPNCICLSTSTVETMRPDQPLPQELCWEMPGSGDFVRTCDVTYDEFYAFAQPKNEDEFTDRFKTFWAHAAGNWKLLNPLILLWIFSMGYGNGFTCRILGSKIMGRLAPLAYPVYLLHMAVSRYYWLATRGLQSEYWFDAAGIQPFPVEWYEYFIVLGITSFLGYVINSFMVPWYMPHSIRFGVQVATKTCDILYCYLPCVCCFLKPEQPDIRILASITYDTEDGDSSSNEEAAPSPTNTSSLIELQSMVGGLTGVEVSPSMELRSLGLDSLGATALFGMLKASVPSAKRLTLLQLQRCKTIQDLALVLDGDPRSATMS